MLCDDWCSVPGEILRQLSLSELNFVNYFRGTFTCPPFGSLMNCIICNNPMQHFIEDLFRCKYCQLISCDTPLDKSIYDKSYCLKYQRYAQRAENIPLQQLRLDFIKKHIKEGRLLDFGCGNGSFLRYVDGQFENSGFDINPYSGFLNVDVILHDYDIVTFWDSIEHLENPQKIIKGIGPEYIFLSTPSTDDIDLSNILSWRHYIPEEHAHFFNIYSIKKLLNSTGYEVIDYNYNESNIRKSGGEKNILTVAARRRE